MSGAVPPFSFYDFMAYTWTALSSSLSLINPLNPSFLNLHLQFFRLQIYTKVSFFLAVCIPVRCPWDDHTSNILRIITNFLIVFSSVFCHFSLSSSALVHYSLSFFPKKKYTFIQPYKHNNQFCLIYYLSLRCLTESAYLITFAASWVLLCSVCLSVRSPSRFTAVSVSPTVDLLCQHSTSTPFFRLSWNERDKGQLPTTVFIQVWCKCFFKLL
jgi:hypothetical protein